MLLRDLMWKLFQSTGQIEAYLLYCSCLESDEQSATLPDRIQPVTSLS